MRKPIVMLGFRKKEQIDFAAPALATASFLLVSPAYSQAQTGQAYVQSQVDQFNALKIGRPDLILQNTQLVKDTQAAASASRTSEAVTEGVTYDMPGILRSAQGGLNVNVFRNFAGENSNLFMTRGANSPGGLAAYGKVLSNNPRPCYRGINQIGGCDGSSSFPSGHTAKGTGAALLAAYIFPERFQSFITMGQYYGQSRIIVGAHYPLDVMASRALAYKAVADLLAQGAAAPYVLDARPKQIALCGTQSVLTCANSKTESRFSDQVSNKNFYNYTKNYGFSEISADNKPMVVPQNAEYLIQTRFPYLSLDQLREIIRTTADPSGAILDDPWSRINLFAAADGYGSFDTDLTVNMDAARAINQLAPGADYNAADSWNNNIGGPGLLTKTGSGALTLTGSNSFAGFNLQQGGLTLTGSNRLTGSSSVTGGVLTISSNSLSVARDLVVGTAGVLRLDSGGVDVGRTLRIDGNVNLVGPGELRIESAATGLVNGTVSGASTLIKTGSGPLTLAGTNTYSGGTAILGGTLIAANASALGSGAATVATAASLELDGVTLANALTLADNGVNGAGALLGMGTAGLSASVTFAGDTAIGGTGTLTVSAPLGDGGMGFGLTKLGVGTLVLSGTNTFMGSTTVSAGTLVLTATGSLVAPVFVGASGSFLNAGSTSGGVSNVGSLSNGGTIAGGLANTGTAFNSGTITGGAISTGVLTSSGTISGGVSNAGILTTSGILAGGLTNAGVLTSSGTISGGVSNAGILTTSGTLAGGLTNAGTVLASAGRIDGPIRNAAGLLAISGSVASDGSLTNAAGATLAVTGRYSLAGPLTNVGTVNLAANASLVAAAGFSNAGLVVSEGALTADLTNAGVARLSGRLDGSLTNTGQLQVTGLLAGLTGLTNAGALDLGGGTLAVPSLSGPAEAILSNGRLAITGPVSSTYAGAILDGGGTSSLIMAGSGIVSLSGFGGFSGPTSVQSGTLSLNGFWTSPVTVAAAGTLRGIGTIAAPLTVAGAVRPGNSPGTLTVLGPVAFQPGSSLGLDIDGTGTGTGIGSYARLLALGSAGMVTAGGALVPVLRGITGNATNTYTPALGQRFGVLAAQGGLSGSFAGLVQPASGLAAGTRFDVLYAATGLDLVVTPAAYGSLAGPGLPLSGNALAVGAALDLARPTAGTRPDAARARVYDPLYAANPSALSAGLASLSGQSYGDAVMADLAGRRLVTDTIDRHLRGLGGGAAAFGASDLGSGPNRATLQVRGGTGASDQALAMGEGRVWADALYGFGSRASDPATSGAAFDAGGLLTGIDRQIGADTLVGGALSYLREGGSSKGVGLGRFTTDSYGGHFYASTRLGALVLRSTVGTSYANGQIDRMVALGTAVSPASGLALGWNGGVAGFAGYALTTELPVEIVPEMGLSYDRLTRARVAEQGGLAGQSFAAVGLNAARSLVGGRVANLPLEGGSGLRLESRAYWAHELTDVDAVVRSGLFGAPFASRTSALGRDGAVLGANLVGEVADGVTLSVSYTGDVRRGSPTQVFSAGLQARW